MTATLTPGIPARLDYLRGRFVTIAKLRAEHATHTWQLSMYAVQADRVLDEALYLDPTLADHH